MKPHYCAFIELGKTLAREKGLSWDMPLDETGAARDGVGWNLTAIANDVPPPTHYLRDLGADAKALAIINAERAECDLTPLARQPLPLPGALRQERHPAAAVHRGSRPDLFEGEQTALTMDLNRKGMTQSSLQAQVEALRQQIVTEQSNLADIGIKVNILLSPPDSYVKDRAVGQLYWTNYGGAPDPYYQFEWFTCAQFSLWDWAFWCNADYDNMWNQIAIEEDEAKRTQIAIKMQQLMDESASFVWSNYQFTNAVSRAGIQAVFDRNGNPVVQYFKPA